MERNEDARLGTKPDLLGKPLSVKWLLRTAGFDYGLRAVGRDQPRGGISARRIIINR
jgi:hypothetical protein